MPIKQPHITEKAAALSDKKQYVFKVETSATKPQIKRAVEKLYGVKVKAVRIISLPGKSKRLGRTLGFRPGFKKAVVTLREGKIEFA